MIFRKFRRPSAALALLPVALASCAATGLYGPPVTREALGLTGIVARGPEGYCVVPRLFGAGGDDFALLAACALFSQEARYPLRNGIVAIQAGEAGSAELLADPQALAAHLETPAGRALLTGTDGAGVEIVATAARAGRVTLAYEGAGAEIPNVQDTTWRGFVDLGDRIVTVRLRALAGAPLDLADGLALLDSTLDALEAENRGL